MPDGSENDEQGQAPASTGASEWSRLAAPVSTTVACSFLDLPADLHYLIVRQYLPWQAGLALRQTCTYFSSLLSPSRVQILRLDMARRFVQDEVELRRIWQTPRWWCQPSAPNEDLLGLHCFSCMRQLHPADFVHAQTIRGLGLGGGGAARRWCKPCGLKWGWAQPGAWYRECWEGHRSVRWLWYADLRNGCAQCFEESASTWWGCVACFETVERRRQKEDRDRAPAGVDVMLAVCQKWRRFRAASARKRLQRQQLGRVRSAYQCHPLTVADRRVADEDEARRPSQGSDRSKTAVDLAHQPRDKRWQTRCLKCWRPSCRPRPERTNLAFERALSRDQWCAGCIADEAYFLEKRQSQERAQPQPPPPPPPPPPSKRSLSLGGT